MAYDTDSLDHRLIALLRTDARRPVSALATDVGVSRATVRARIDRLVDQGIIRGFTVVLRAGAETAPVRAMTTVEVAGPSAESVLLELNGFPEVRRLHTTNGRWDIVAEIESDSLQQFDETLRRVRLLKGVAATETSLLLSQRKSDC